jgi:hypothetical protein
MAAPLYKVLKGTHWDAKNQRRKVIRLEDWADRWRESQREAFLSYGMFWQIRLSWYLHVKARESDYAPMRAGIDLGRFCYNRRGPVSGSGWDSRHGN